MTQNTQSNASQTAAKRTPRLSPELNEFLHMLNALEGQFGSDAERVQ